MLPFDLAFYLASTFPSAGSPDISAAPFNATDRGLFAPIYVFSPIIPWQPLAAKHLAATAASSDGHLFEESFLSSQHYIFRLFKILPERTLSFGCPPAQSVI